MILLLVVIMKIQYGFLEIQCMDLIQIIMERKYINLLMEGLVGLT